MAVIEYADFDLEVVSEGAGYRTLVRSAPAGAGKTATFPALDDAALVEILGHVAHPRDAIHVGVLTGSAEGSVERLKTFGAGLFGTLLAGDVGDAFAASRRETAERATGLRIRLRLPSDLADVPWEFLFHQTLDRFLCLSVDTPIVRFLEVPEPVGIVQVAPPLRILVMASDPTDHPKLDVEGEVARLQEALADAERRGLVTLERTDGATMDALQDRLLQGDHHVFHYIGHGGFDEEHQDGLLVLEGPGKVGALVPGDDLGVVLNGHHPLRLAVLNTCEGAKGSPKDPFAGTAQGLIQQGVPAVIAMQFPISDVAAKTFAQRLYSTIALGYPVDAALCEARKTVYLTGNRLEWATPVLYMRTVDGRIFSIEGAAPVEARVAEIDPLAPADRAPDAAEPTSIVADGKELDLTGAHGALLSAAEERPGRSPRRPPLDLRPKDFPELLGRDEAVRTITSAFLTTAGTASEPVELFGPSGTGKTALVRNVAHHPSAQFESGVVYTASRQPAPDLLRFLFQTFYETPEPLMPNEAELRDAMQRVEALVFLDDVGLDREQVETLTNIAPRCLFVLASDAQLLYQGGPAFLLGGLDEKAALQLLERRLGRPLAPDELPDARAVVEAVAGVPLLLVQAASRIRTEGLTIAQVLEEARARPSTVAPLVAVPSLTEGETRVAAVLAAVAAPIGGDLLGAATGLPDAAAVAASLQERGLVRSQGPRWSLAQSPTPELAAALESRPWGDRALEAMTEWADGFVFGSAAILEETDALAGIMRWAEARGRWGSVARLGRAIERPLALAGRWERWRDVLQRALGAAEQQGDRGQEAWARHQLGTRHVGLDQIEEGRALLRQALEIREGIGDVGGAEATRRNLDFIDGTPTPRDGPKGDTGVPPVPPIPPIPPPPPRPRKIWPWVLVAIAVILGIGAVVFRPNGAGASLAADPGSIDFGERTVSTEGEPVTVTITSTGDQTLAIGAIRLERSDGFRIETDTCSNAELPAGTACSIVVSFLPGAEGLRTAELLVPHNAEGSPLRVDLAGTGIRPQGSPTPEPFARLSVDPEEPLTFSSVRELRTLTILSTGTATLEVQLSLDPIEAAEQFRIVESGTDCVEPISLGPGASCRITFAIAGNPDLPTSATLRLSSNGGEVSVTLSGVPAVAISSDTFSFDSEDKRYESFVTVSNTGTGTFEVLSATMDPDVIEIVSDGCSGVAVVPGGSCSIAVASTSCRNAAVLVIEDTTVDVRHSAQISLDRCVE